MFLDSNYNRDCMNFVEMQSFKNPVNKNLSMTKIEELDSEGPENSIAQMAIKHPESKEYCQEMCRRLGLLSQIIVEIQIKQRERKKEVLAPILRELEFFLHSRNFIGEATSARSVGYNPLAIHKAMVEGTFQEQMTLIYHGLWTIFSILESDLPLLHEVDKQLREIGDFNLNLVALEKDRSEKGTFFPLPNYLVHFRKNGRLVRHINTDKKLTLNEITDLTYREARISIEDYISPEEFKTIQLGKITPLSKKAVKWRSGQEYFDVNKESDFYKIASLLGNVPILTGPSGTTDGFLRAVDYLGMPLKYKKSGTLALIGWLIANKDHSLYEIRIAAHHHGIDYNIPVSELLN